MRKSGEITRIEEKGFGFIVDAATVSYFFHARSCDPANCRFAELRVGDLVSFEGEWTEKGLRAIQVRRVGGGAGGGR